jgi:AcrR family transcriptional regulator
MRARLLEATVATLFDRGYSRTTTTEIARRARVSRGAQVHHFPTKDRLVITAMRHLFLERTREFREAFDALPASADRATAAVDLLWTMLSGPTFYAWLELVVAARTNAKLRRAVEPLATEFVDRVQQTFRRLFPGSALPVAPHFAFALLQGLAVDSIVLPDAPHVGFIIEQLRALARLVILQKEPIG